MFSTNGETYCRTASLLCIIFMLRSYFYGLDFLSSFGIKKKSVQ